MSNDIPADVKKINLMWRWRRRAMISSLMMLFGSGLYLLISIANSVIKPEILNASGPFFAWWFGSLTSIIVIYIGGAVASDISEIIKTKAGGG